MNEHSLSVLFLKSQMPSHKNGCFFISGSFIFCNEKQKYTYQKFSVYKLYLSPHTHILYTHIYTHPKFVYLYVHTKYIV